MVIMATFSRAAIYWAKVVFSDSFLQKNKSSLSEIIWGNLGSSHAALSTTL